MARAVWALKGGAEPPRRCRMGDVSAQPGVRLPRGRTLAQAATDATDAADGRLTPGQPCDSSASRDTGGIHALAQDPWSGGSSDHPDLPP